MAGGLATARAVWLKVHLWLGLGIGFFFGIAALTGAMIVFQPELEGLFNDGAYPTTPGDIGVASILAHVEALSPGATVREVRWPRPGEPIYTVQLTDGGARRTLRLDPGSGAVVEATRGRSRVFAGVRRLHTSLLAGPIGARVVLYTSMLSLLSMVSGLVLWWPGFGRLRRGFAVRTRRGFYTFNFDLHQTLGAAALPLLLLITLSGVALPYVGVIERVASSRARGDAGHGWAPIRLDGRAEQPLAPPGVTAAAAVAAVPRAKPGTARFPTVATQPVEVSFQAGDWGESGLITVFVDPRDGRVLQVRDPRDLDAVTRFARNGVENIHIGRYGGPPIRVLYVTVCLIGAGLPVSGALIWWLKRRKKAAVEDARAAAVRAEAT